MTGLSPPQQHPGRRSHTTRVRASTGQRRASATPSRGSRPSITVRKTPLSETVVVRSVMPRMRAHALFVSMACLMLTTCLPGLAGARVLLIVVDGLDAREVTPDVMPVLARAWHASPWCPGMESVASMPTRTNSNHATLITGVQPEVHGVTGNAVWDRTEARVRKLGTAADLQAETIFTLAHRAARGLRTAAAVGKPKLGAMFAGDGTRQLGPDDLWDARSASDSARDEVTGYAYDGTTLAAARALLERGGIDFMFINLSDVDRVSHGFGPRAPQAIETRRRTDAALGSFFGWLAAGPDWSTTTIVVTADHGFDAVERFLTFADDLTAASLRGVEVVGDGGTGHVYLTDVPRSGRPSEKLAAVRRVALANPDIAEALYLRPNPDDGGDRFTVDVVHPDWHLRHERSGDLVLTTKPGRVFVDGSHEESKLVGNHGGPGERRVPVFVLAGTPVSEPADCRTVTPADLGRTVQWCLGLPEATRLDAAPIPATDRGHVLPGLCASPTPLPSPASQLRTRNG